MLFCRNQLQATKKAENAQTPTSQVHAVLAAVAPTCAVNLQNQHQQNVELCDASSNLTLKTNVLGWRDAEK